MVELVAQSGESQFFVQAKILVSQSQPFQDALARGWKEAIDRWWNSFTAEVTDIPILLQYLHPSTKLDLVVLGHLQPSVGQRPEDRLITPLITANIIS